MAYDIIIGRDAADKERFGDKGLIFLGKGYVKMGNTTSLSNKIWLDVARSHVILIAGKRGTGKSYSLAVIAEELASLPEENAQNIAPFIFDTMGIFWTMKFENQKEKPLLDKWGLKTKSLPVKVFVPFGKQSLYEDKGIPFDQTFALKVSELQAEDWISLFNLEMTSLPGVLIERIITELTSHTIPFTIEDIQQKIQSDETARPETKEVVYSLFKAAETWGIFSTTSEGTEITDLITAGTTTVLDISSYSSTATFNIRALVISLLCKKMFQDRMDSRKKEELEAIQQGQEYLSASGKRDKPLIWIFIDECLTGDTEIITDKAHTSLQEIISNIDKGERVNVLGFDTEKEEFSYHPVTQVYKKGKKKIIEILTETGKKIKCTPEHRVLTRDGFASAFSVDEIASPLVQHYSERDDCIKARLVGHLFGDGWASEKTESLGFSGKKNAYDLEMIKRDLAKVGLKSSNIFSRETHSQIENSKGKIVVMGTSHSIQASTKAYRIFSELGIIKGDKILSPSKIPEWIMRGDDKIKAEFIAALMGSDGQKVSSAKNARGDFNAIRFSFNKLEILEKEAWEYANKLKELLASLEIKVSAIKKEEGNIRKNGDKTLKIVLTLEKNLENMIRFLEKVGYRYCTEKEYEGAKWLAYLKARIYLKGEREKIYKRAHELHAQGWGKVKIAQELRFPEARIRDWIYMDIKPGIPKDFPDYKEWIQQRLKNKVLYERVVKIEEKGEEEIYDISVEKVHNFISNGLITHNCHEFMPRDTKTPATDALMQLLREGRQPGISLVMATQQPGQIHRDVMTQSDIVIAHRLTAKPDVDALNEIMQTYLLENIQKQMNDLPSEKGSAILLDDNSERIYPLRVRPRFTWHGGEAPVSVKADLIV